MKVQEREIFLEELVLDVGIGIHEFEAAVRQRVLVNVTLRVDPAIAPRDDDIGSVLDYDFLRDEIRALAADRRYNLQETLCEEIARVCLSRAGVVAAEVSTSKPDVYTDCRTVGYRLRARRD